jgi:hypothetical protein
MLWTWKHTVDLVSVVQQMCETLRVPLYTSTCHWKEYLQTNMYKWVKCVFFYLFWLVLIWTDTHLFGFMFEIRNPVNAPWNIYRATDLHLAQFLPGGGCFL